MLEQDLWDTSQLPRCGKMPCARNRSNCLACSIWQPLPDFQPNPYEIACHVPFVAGIRCGLTHALLIIPLAQPCTFKMMQPCKKWGTTQSFSAYFDGKPWVLTAPARDFKRKQALVATVPLLLKDSHFFHYQKRSITLRNISVPLCGVITFNNRWCYDLNARFDRWGHQKFYESSWPRAVGTSHVCNWRRCLLHMNSCKLSWSTLHIIAGGIEGTSQWQGTEIYW